MVGRPEYSSSSTSHYRSLNSTVKNRIQRKKKKKNGAASIMESVIIWIKKPYSSKTFMKNKSLMKT